MIMGDNPLTVVHVTRDVETIDREALILVKKKHQAQLFLDHTDQRR